jgi:hypothetical protein
VNISLFPTLDSPTERAMADSRSHNYTCVVEGGLFSKSSRTRFQMGCTRCGNECPLLVNYLADRADGSLTHGGGPSVIEVADHSLLLEQGLEVTKE